MLQTDRENRQFRLAARPVSLPKASDWEYVTDVARIGEVVEGLEAFSHAVLKLFSGENFGKLCLRVS